MKIRHFAPLAIAASAAAIALAPIASADVSVQQHPGNAQVTARRARLRKRPPRTSSPSAGTRALCCSTTDNQTN